jgi:DNA-directed RNA polymerase subunit E'/Rpb7
MKTLKKPCTWKANMSYVRPIVRGKTSVEVEFGAKVSVSPVDGFTFVDPIMLGTV